MYGYSKESLLNAHKPDCQGIIKRAVKIEMPEPNTKLKFQNHHKQLPAPFVVYADFESLIKKVSTAANDPKKSATRKTQLHEACSYCYVVVRSDGKTKQPVVYRGPDAAEHFLKALQNEADSIVKELLVPKAAIITNEVLKEYNSATVCHICEEPLNGDKVLDHDHITGLFRGPAHNACNLKLRINRHKLKIPVVFHNLRGYDSHLIMQSIGALEGKITCIPNNTEKYISFAIGNLRFIDSAQFLLASLDKLVSANTPESFRITAQYEPDPIKQKLLLRKGIYPYEYIDSPNRFNEDSLPPRKMWYNKLNDSDISDEDFDHAQKVWRTFDCKTLGDYSDLYCRTDVLLLADVFENFRKTCMQHYKLDPANYYTSPGLSWDALLKKTKIELELLSDYDMHLFIERGLRGGISMVSTRYAKANNPKTPDYDQSKPNSYIMYLDANNLYGWAMSQPLPTHNFEWVPDCEELSSKILTHPDCDSKGYILEVDLEYPSELHDTHNAYPLAPERLTVQKDWLGKYQKSFDNKNAEVPKLVPNLRNKERYILHYRNLQLYTQLGLKLTKIHRALQFNQSKWMEPYIRMNTELRKHATNDFEKDLYKLMNNSVFGKTMENLRKRVDVKLVRPGPKLNKLINSVFFDRAIIFNDTLAGLSMHKKSLILNRPVYVGMSILDLSKHLMYDFYYNFLKKTSDCNLLYTDTDSLLVKIETEDVYKDMAENLGMYDTSNYPSQDPLYSSVNKKVLGKMKDECGGATIYEYVGLRSKMYSIYHEKIVDQKGPRENIRKAKGVKKNIVKQQLRHEQYKKALFEKRNYRHTMNVLRSRGHRVYGEELNKVSLCGFDSKRYICEDGVTTLAYGSSSIKKFHIE